MQNNCTGLLKLECFYVLKKLNQVRFKWSPFLAFKVHSVFVNPVVGRNVNRNRTSIIVKITLYDEKNAMMNCILFQLLLTIVYAEYSTGRKKR